MQRSKFLVIPLFLSAIAGAVVASSSKSSGFNLRSFRVDLSRGASRMIEMVKNTHLPDDPEYPDVGSTQGIDLDALRSLQQEWVTVFDWAKEERAMNEYSHFKATIENLTIHFIHERSGDHSAIPLLLLHGWPGSFLEFLPVVAGLTQAAKTSAGRHVSFHVIIPSLPGFAFSSAPPANWTGADTARVLNTLMTQTLGYKTFAVFGTDFGSLPAWILYEQYNSTTRAAHFDFVPFLPLSPAAIIAMNYTQTPNEQFEEQNFVAWSTTGNAYFNEMETKPNTIGLALYDNPIGQLAWMGEKFIAWSDPRRGTGASILDNNSILTSISLYYLTKSFVSAAYMYAQNPNPISNIYTRARTDAPYLFSGFRYNLMTWPIPVLREIGNLTYYKDHTFGGHFPGLDNPSALVSDLREIKTYWYGPL